MLEATVRDHIQNEDLRRRTGVNVIIAKMQELWMK